MEKFRYRIFTNDRGEQNGVPMYSALKEVKAASPEQALKECPSQFTYPHYAPAKAIRWPAKAQSGVERAWLEKHVGGVAGW